MNKYVRPLLLLLCVQTATHAKYVRGQKLSLQHLANTTETQERLLGKEAEDPTTPSPKEPTTSKGGTPAAKPQAAHPQAGQPQSREEAVKILSQFLEKLYNVNPQMAIELSKNPQLALQYALNPQAAARLFSAAKGGNKSFLEKVKGSLLSWKQRLSLSSAKQAAFGFLGRSVLRVWDKVFDMIAKVMELVVGKDKFYQMNKDGSVKVNTGPPLRGPAGIIKTGDPLPLLVTVKKQDLLGRVGRYQEPSSWYMARHSKQQMLALIQGAAIEKTVKALISSLERAVIRPFLSAQLALPEWKLSYEHYMLFMYEKAYPGENILDPERLCERMHAHITSKHFKKQTKPPFELNEVLAIRDKATQKKQLERKILEHMSKSFAPLQSVLEKGNQDFSVFENREAELRAQLEKLKKGQGVYLVARNPEKEQLKDVVMREAKNLGKGVKEDATMAAMMTSPFLLAIPMTLALTQEIAISLPKALVQKFAGSTAPEHVPDNTRQLAAIRLQALLFSRILHLIRDNKKPIGKTVIALRLSGEQGSFDKKNFLLISPLAQHRLLAMQEKLIKTYQTFIEPDLRSAINNMSYEQFITKLILPRLLTKAMPKTAAAKLAQLSGREDLLDEHGNLSESYIAQHQDHVEAFMEGSFHTVIATVEFIAAVKSFMRMEKLAGNYVKLFDSIDNVLYHVHQIGAAQGINPDNLLSRGAKRLYRKLPFAKSEQDKMKTALFTLAQERRYDHIIEQVPGFTLQDPVLLTMQAALIERAAQKRNGTHTPQAGEYTVDQWLDALQEHVSGIKAKKDFKRNEFFGGKAATAEQIRREAERINQQARSSVRNLLTGLSDAFITLHGAYHDWGIRDFLTIVDRTGVGITAIPGKALMMIASHAVVPHLVGKGLEYIFSKTLLPLMARIRLFHHPSLQSALMRTVAGLLSTAEQAAGVREDERKSFGYRIGHGVSKTLLEGFHKGGPTGAVMRGIRYVQGALGGVRMLNPFGDGSDEDDEEILDDNDYVDDTPQSSAPQALVHHTPAPPVMA